MLVAVGVLVVVVVLVLVILRFFEQVKETMIMYTEIANKVN